jgi:hypothetical protein
VLALLDAEAMPVAPVNANAEADTSSADAVRAARFSRRDKYLFLLFIKVVPCPEMSVDVLNRNRNKLRLIPSNSIMFTRLVEFERRVQ